MQNEPAPGDNPTDHDSFRENQRREQYWRANLKLVAICLILWFLASYGCGILFADFLNQFQLFGFKLGFWFAQQGSIFAFLLLIVFYVRRINALDRRFGVQEDDDAEGTQ